MSKYIRKTRLYAPIRSARSIVRTKLSRRLAVFKRSRSRAKFIAITGSSAKSTTASLLAHILESTAKSRSQLIKNGLQRTLRTLANLNKNDVYVILEIGTEAQGQIAEIASFVRPDIAIVTLVALEHYSSFRNIDNVAREKSALVEALAPSGLAILNKEDPRVLAMTDLTSARVVTFGTQGADYEQSQIDAKELGRLAFTLSHCGRQLRLQTRLTGAHNCVAVSAAAACALELGIPEATVVQRVATFEPVFGRLSIHKFTNGPTFILDSAKAPFHSLRLTIDVLKNGSAPRKRFILGHISDYAGNPRAKYRDTYRAALAVSDQVLMVGANAHKSRATKAEIDAGKFVAFENVEDVSKYVKATAIENEIILIKSSNNLHLDRIMLDWEAPIQCWPNECGISIDCRSCGLHGRPFPEHRGKKPSRLMAALTKHR